MEQGRHGDRLNARPLGASLLTLGVGACGSTLGAPALPRLPPGSRVFPSESHYEVSGTTPSEIGRSLAAGSAEALGGSYLGLHRWRIEWTYGYQEHGGRSCRVTAVSIELHSEISLPEWIDRERADSAVVTLWNAYESDLRAHEYGHRLHAYQAAQELSQEVQRVRAPACGAIGARVGATARRILDKYGDIDDAWDADPAHRADWPPRPRDGSVSRDSAGRSVAPRASWQP
jgi:predicted secreted Zn-dependent protease